MLSRTFLASTLFAASLFASNVAEGQGGPPEAARILSLWTGLVEELRGALDRRVLDPERLVQDLEFQPEAIIAFVREHVAYRTYPGIMLGAEGALRHRAGNAIDQALLLAHLLRLAGYDARIAGAELSSENARIVLAEIRQRPRRKVPALTEAAAPIGQRMHQLLASTSEFAAAAEEDRLDQEGLVSAEQAEIVENVLRDALDAAGIDFSPQPLPEEMINEAQAYFWVEYRVSALDAFSAVHPVFASQPTFAERLRAESYFSQNVPQELLQTLTLQAFARVRSDGRVTTEPLFAPWTKPVASLIDRRLAYSHAFDLTELEDDTTVKRRMFTPTLDAGQLYSVKAFNSDGAILPADFVLDPAAGFSANLNRRGSSAMDALGAIGSGNSDSERNESASQALEEVWLEINVAAPGGPDHVVRRSMGRTASSLARKLELNVLAGVPDRAALLDMIFAELVAHLQAAVDPEASYSLEQQRPWADPVLLAMLAQAPAVNGVSYRPQPLLVGRHSSLLHGQTIGIDILSSPLRSVTGLPNAPMLAPALSLQRGSWEAAAETSLATLFGEGAYSATTGLIETRMRGHSLRVLEAAPQILPESPQEDPRRLISAAMQAGDVVVVPPGDAPPVFWWQIDPVSGRTIGVLANGWGGGLTNFVEGLIARPAMANEGTEYVVTQEVRANTACFLSVVTLCEAKSLWLEALLYVFFQMAGGPLFDDLIGVGLPPGSKLKDAPAYKYAVEMLIEEIGYLYYRRCVAAELPKCAAKVMPLLTP